MARTKWITVTLTTQSAKYNPPVSGTPTPPTLVDLTDAIVFVKGRECLMLKGGPTFTFDLRPGQYELYIKDRTTANDDPLVKKQIRVTGFETGNAINMQISASWLS